MKKGIILLFAIAFFSSCYFYKVPRYIEKNFDYCYNEHPSGLDTIINLKGFYRLPVIKKDKPEDTTFWNFLLLPDGTCIFDFYLYDKINRKPLNINVIDSSNVLIGSQFKGLYQVFGDTIKIKLINHISFGMAPTWAAWEKSFKIVDKNTLQYIKSIPFSSRDKSNIEIFNRAESNRIYFTATFIPIKKMPNTKFWLKDKKWFWCNKDEWEVYMKKKND
ncbi:MAG: hypothetical protein K9J13_15095 [Saprospiraceae bacterium]|nr:hypothetical protein [Saprospiraceae bacterium]